MALKSGALALCMGAVLAAGAAQAQGVSYSQSPRTGSMKLKLGSYNPGDAMDSEAGLTTTPYHNTFGNAGMLLFEVSYDHYFWQKVGAAGVGLSVGYAERYATAKTDTGDTANEKTGIVIAPLKLMAVYSFDYAALHWNVPLVPYARLGLAYTPWFFMKGGGVEYVDGQRMAGGKFGLAATGGLALMLDFLEPRMAADFDTDLGVNHSYFFAEYNLTQANNFNDGKLNLSSNYLMFGLALDF